MASNARCHISIGRDSSGAALLTCTSRPRTTRTKPGLPRPAEEQHDLGEVVARAGAVAGEVVEVERFGHGAGVVEQQPARRGSAAGRRAPSG